MTRQITVKPEFCVVHNTKLDIRYYGPQVCSEHQAAADAMLAADMDIPSFHNAVVILRRNAKRRHRP